MAFTPSATVMAKTKRKTRKPGTPLPRTEAHGAELNPAEVALPEEIAAFDPHVFLTKLAAGKTIRQYKADESVFSQGDASTSRAAG